VAQQAREPPSCRGLGPEERVEPLVAAPKVEIDYCLSGDWVRLTVDGKIVNENHSLDERKWAGVLRSAGCEVVETNRKPSFFSGDAADDEGWDESYSF
jgi:hypothetical protein